MAAGSGSRFGGERPKQLALLAGRPLISHTLAVFEASALVEEIILVLPENQWREVIINEAVAPFGFSKVRPVSGGASRTESSLKGFAASSGDIVLVHDGVRPFVTETLIEKVAESAVAHGVALAAVPVRDTVKEAEEGFSVKTLDRSRLWQAQTPQGFRRDIFKKALDAAQAGEATDDVALAERLGFKAALVESTFRNFKITAPEDLEMAEALLGAPTLRVGNGYDVHRFEAGRPLFLGCVQFDFPQGLKGHSDADVMAHALADALLGAACLGDIGSHFPDKDPKWAGVSGAAILAETMKKVRDAGFEFVQADVTLIGEKPKIAPFREAMATAMARALGVSPACLNVKGTTTEGLDAVGQGLALASLATATLKGFSFPAGSVS